MFRHAELGRTVAKKEYADQVGPLRERLLEAQFQLAEADFPVIVLFAGVDGAGKGEVVNTLGQWLDIRRLRTRSFGRASPEEQKRPRFWRFWKALPPKGAMGLFLSAWYHEPLLDRVHGPSSKASLDAELDQIAAFEKLLADDGALIVKFWLHLSRDAQRQRFEELESNPATSWRVTEQDWEHWQLYDKFVRTSERLIAKTSKGEAPWHVIEGACPRYRMLEIGGQLADAIERHLVQRRCAAEVTKSVSESQTRSNGHPVNEPPHQVTVLSKLERPEPPAKADYRRDLKQLQARLNLLHRRAHEAHVPTVMAFEGWDAAGKGGAIRRITAALDVRTVNVVPIAAPTDEELARHYLWRFWRNVPGAGEVTIFDRSWYGRVLVERVMGLATESEWRRAYAEINDFERQLLEAGAAVARFWLHISPEEQEARFQARADTSYKRWKLTDEDWRNRERWAEYELAVHDMVSNTASSEIPWSLIDANSKHHARIRVLEAACEAIERALQRRGVPFDDVPGSNGSQRDGKSG